MEGWLWLLIFYAVVAGVWTWRRYLRVKEKETWRKDLSLHLVESFSWLLVLLRTDYRDDNKQENEKH